MISNSELRDRFAIRRAALHAIRESARRVILANPYFVPDRGVLRALQRAAGRAASTSGCCCRWRATPTVLDLAARAVFGPLLAAGVRVWQSRAVVHTKVLAVDDTSCRSAATTSITGRSSYNLEMVVNVIDASDVEGDDRDAGVGHRRQRGADARHFRRRPLLMRLMERSPTRSASGSSRSARAARVRRQRRPPPRRRSRRA